MEYTIIAIPLNQYIDITLYVRIRFFKLDIRQTHIEIVSFHLQLKSGILYIEALFHVIHHIHSRPFSFNIYETSGVVWPNDIICQ